MDGSKPADADTRLPATTPVACGAAGLVPAWLQAANMLGARQQQVCKGKPAGRSRGSVCAS